MSDTPSRGSLLSRVPFFYGWIVVLVAFVTMGVGVNARSAFSLLFPPILDEFGWSRGDTAAAFAFGFLVSSFLSPFLGAAIDRFGPRLVFPAGAVIVTIGLLATTFSSEPWHLSLSLGIMVVGGSVIIAYVGHSAFLPNWFVRRRGLAIGIAFSGVGVFAMIIMPALQVVIDEEGWRTACYVLAVLVFVGVVPLNLLLQRRRPQDLGLEPDGDAAPLISEDGQALADNVVDRAWAETDWTVRRAIATRRFWWLAAAFFFTLFGYYAILVHQTRFLTEVGFSSTEAAFAFALVGFLGVPGLLVLGYLSDRIGREWAWSIACCGFITCFGLLVIIDNYPLAWLMYLMVAAQGLLGYGMSPNYAAIPAELFQGRHYGAVFGTLSLAATAGAAAGPWVTGLLFDHFQSYVEAFTLAMLFSALSIPCVWFAAPRKVRLVAGQVRPKD